MRILSGVVAAGGLAAASPALAEAPGPFVCSLGDSEAILSANEGATEYSGTFRLAGDYAGLERSEPETLTLSQRFSGWRYVYANEEMTMVILGDEAMLYGDFGESRCFASRSVPVGEGWQYGPPDDAPITLGAWKVVAQGETAWRELAEDGAALTWGGNVRAGPGTEFDRVAGVPLGVEVGVLARTDRTWLDEYPWFKVRLGTGRVGYIAGGLLCTRDNRTGFYNARNCEG